MRIVMTAVCLLSLILFPWITSAQENGSPEAATLPAVEPVTSHIPAGAMGFFVINNIQATTSNFDAYLDRIGLSEMTQTMMPTGSLDMIKMLTFLGEGFNPNGGLAAVMLDPHQFGVDLLAMMGLSDGEPAGEVKLPFIILVPGSSVEEVFGFYPITEDGKYKTVQLRMGEMITSQCGSYVALSPTAEALDAFLLAERKVDLNTDKSALITRSDFALQINMKIATPIITKMMDKNLEKAMATSAPAEVETVKELSSKSMKTYMEMYKNILAQINEVTCGLQLGETGLIGEEIVDFDPQSQAGKVLAAFKPVSAPTLDRVPNIGYVLAASAIDSPSEANTDLTTDMIDNFLASETFANVDDETKAALKDLSLQLDDQITNAQLVIGGAPEGSGVLGISCVMDCKDSAKVKELLSSSAGLSETLIKAMCEDEQFQQLGISYAKDVDKIGEIAVDAINITHPELDELEQEKREQLKNILGSDTFTAYIAATDEKHVVVTFGGAKAYLAEAVKAAGGSENILASESASEAMKHMPKNASGVVLLNVPNLLELASKVQEASDQPTMGLPKLTSQAPITIGAGISGSQGHVVAYVPNELIEELVQLGMSMARPQTQPTQPQEDNGEEF